MKVSDNKQSAKSDYASVNGAKKNCSFISGLENSLGVAEEVWRPALGKILPDPVASIKHAELDGEAEWRLHVAEIPEKVTCHVHFKGSEIYEIVEGEGILHYGPVVKIGGNFKVDWQEPLAVKTGDTFTIPEAYAHQLVRTGATALIIIFACPDRHLADDRIVLADE